LRDELTTPEPNKSLLRYGRERVNSTPAPVQYSCTVWFMNTLSLSVSNPSRTKGKTLRISLSTSVSSFCSRTNTGAHSVHPVAMSVNVSVCT